MTDSLKDIIMFFIYNAREEGFLKIKYFEYRKPKGYKGHPVKQQTFDRWGDAGHGEMYVINEHWLDQPGYLKQKLEMLGIPDLNFDELYIVPQTKGQGGHSPDFANAFTLKSHISKKDEQYLP